MSRAGVNTGLLLLLLCGASAFALRAMREPDAVVAPPADADADAAPSIASSAAAVPADRLADRLERIDARLAALSAERRAPPPQALVPEMPPAEVGRRLARLLPGGVVDSRGCTTHDDGQLAMMRSLAAGSMFYISWNPYGTCTGVGVETGSQYKSGVTAGV